MVFNPKTVLSAAKYSTDGDIRRKIKSILNPVWKNYAWSVADPLLEREP